MTHLDPRSAPALSRAPAVAGCGVVFLAAALGLAAARLAPAVAPALTDASSVAHRSRPALAPAPGSIALELRVRPGETLLAAVARTGVAPEEARLTVALLSRAFDVAHVRAGLKLQAAVAPRGPATPARLVDLSLRTGPASAVSVSRTASGALTLRETRAVVRDDTAVAAGVIRGSFYESAVRAGVTPTLVAEASRLFARSLDFARDIHGGEGFRLVFDRTADAGGRTVEAGDLLYAEVTADGRARRFYRLAHDGRVDYVDDLGAAQKPLLLKTPLDGARVTSAFGMRLHPLLGYTRIHPGIDFGAPTGTPVYAAGDGVVEEARWAGGYGHWLKLGHADGWETGYGHLSRYAAGVRPGVPVTQGQVVAYVGSTGLSTGPHLHYEIMHGGAKLNPASVKAPTAPSVDRAAAAEFIALKRRVDGLLARGTTLAEAGAPVPLRPREGV